MIGEQFKHPLRWPGQNGAVAAHDNRALQQLWACLEGSKHSLVILERQLTRTRLLHPNNIPWPQTRFSEQLSDLGRREWIDYVVDPLELDPLLGQQREQVAAGRAGRLFVNGQKGLNRKH